MGLYIHRDNIDYVSWHHLFIIWVAHHQCHLDARFFFFFSTRGVVSIKQREGNKGYICIGSFFTSLCHHHQVDLDAK